MEAKPHPEKRQLKLWGNMNTQLCTIFFIRLASAAFRGAVVKESQVLPLNNSVRSIICSWPPTAFPIHRKIIMYLCKAFYSSTYFSKGDSFLRSLWLLTWHILQNKPHLEYTHFYQENSIHLFYLRLRTHGFFFLSSYFSPALLNYNSQIKIAYFKVYNMLFWYMHILWHDYHS